MKYKQLRIDGGYDEPMKTEAKIQQEIVQWFRNEYAQSQTIKPIIFSVVNEHRNANKFISTGLLPGVSDLIVLIPNRTIFVEVKDAKGTQKPNQIKFQQKVDKLGYNYYLVRSLEEFKRIL